MSGRRIRVMVVDDAPDNLRVSELLLTALDCDVSCCSDGESCLLAIEETRPDLVLLDLGLPHMNGVTVGNHVRQMPLSPMPLIVAVTGFADSHTIGSCLAAGFDRHIVKPISIEQLEALIAEARERAAR